METDLALLSRRIGYDFVDISLAERALSHRSSSALNNERLEFLGDSLLNLIIAEQLYRQFPDAKEGDLSRVRANLVNGTTLADLARELDIGSTIRLGLGERQSGGHRRDSILADAVEALIGAIYLDSDFQRCQERVLCWFRARLADICINDQQKDAKTQLQELLQAAGQPLPKYSLIAREGLEHQQSFQVACKVSSLREPVIAIGDSRKKAEQAAAKATLQKMKKHDD